MSTTYAVEGMTCGGCRARVEEALKAFSPAASVTLDPPRATLEVPLDVSKANAALAKVGMYRLAPLVPDRVSAPADSAIDPLPAKSLATYYPLLLIAGYLVVASFAGVVPSEHAAHETALQRWMMNFMAGFFLVFSFFKLLDLRGFADAYRGYDVIAERWPAWGIVYPLVELALGLAYLFRFAPTLTNWVTLVIMGLSIVGVIRAVSRKQAIRCACLGTVLNLPMSTITLVEDGLMIAMAAWMLWAV